MLGYQDGERKSFLQPEVGIRMASHECGVKLFSTLQRWSHW